jgi:hypothetical protein
MKLTNKIALISGLGCLALVGSGFAAWTYANTTTNHAATDATASVAKIVTVGDVAVSGSLSFVVDDTNNDYVGELDWSGSLTVTYTAASKYETADKQVLTLAYSVAEDSTLTSYFTFTATTGTWSKDQTAYSAADLGLDKFTWGDKVDTAKKYDAMRDAFTAVASKAVVITFTATIA